MKSVEEKKKRRRRTILLLILFVITITIGYSLLSQTLNIKGISRINNATWDIHFENANTTENSNVVAIEDPVASTGGKTTSIYYEVTLHKPGDVYEFTVDVVNKGSVDAKLVGAPQITGISNENLKYTNFKFSYVDDAPVTEGDRINSGKSAKYKVRIEYKRDLTAADLPSLDQTLDINIKMDFEQV